MCKTSLKQWMGRWRSAGTDRKPSVRRHHIPCRSTIWFARDRVLTYCCLICWWYPLCGFSVKSLWLYYRLVRLKHNPSLLLQGILNKANPDRATVTTDPAGVGKACKASGSVPMRALLLMVDNPAGPIRNIQMKHTQKTEGKKQEEKRGQDRKGHWRTWEGRRKGKQRAKGEGKGVEIKDGRSKEKVTRKGGELW